MGVNLAVKLIHMADLGAEKFMHDEFLKYLGTTMGTEWEVHLVRSAMRHALDAAMETCVGNFCRGCHDDIRKLKEEVK